MLFTALSCLLAAAAALSCGDSPTAPGFLPSPGGAGYVSLEGDLVWTNTVGPHTDTVLVIVAPYMSARITVQSVATTGHEPGGWEAADVSQDWEPSPYRPVEMP